MKFSAITVIALGCISAYAEISHVPPDKKNVRERSRRTATDTENKAVKIDVIKNRLLKETKRSKNPKYAKLGKSKKEKKPVQTHIKACSAGQDPEKTEELKSAIFDPPTALEMDKILSKMEMFDFSKEGENIILTPAPLAGPNRDEISKLFGNESLATSKKTSPPGAIWGGIQTTYISRIDTFSVPKSEAVKYLFEDGTKPDRYAQVNVAFGSLSKPKFVEYKVGPLSAKRKDMRVRRLSGVDQIWGSRPREGNEMRALKTMVDYILNEDEFLTICRESFAGKTHGNGLNNHEPAPPGLIGVERKTQILINFAIEGTWRGKDLNVVPLSFTIDNTAQDPSMWVAEDFYYYYQGPFTRDELVEKYFDGTLDKITIPKEHFDEIQKSSFPQRRPELPERDFSTLPGPQMYMPEGARYTVHGRTVKWMGWEFHAGYTFRSGPNFKNIKFMGDRIAYEVALNEVGLIYSANDPVAGNVFFMDSTFGNGEYRELMRGIDCPDYATYITNYWWAAPGGTQTALRSTCIFEVATGSTLWRRGGPFVSGLPKTELHVRFAMPNGNYDYVMTYKFSLDGEIGVDIASSGYIQSHYMPDSRKSEDSMAYRVHTFAAGSLHDHTYGFKVDLDVGTQDNSFMTVEYKTGSTLDAINEGRKTPLTTKPPYLLFDNMRYVKKETVQTENDAMMDVNPATPKTWIFGDTENKNKWGNTKAYALHLDANTASLIDPTSHTLPAMSYAKHMLHVTVQKDTEDSISGKYDMNRLDSPQFPFEETAVDGESIVQQDLVAWVTLTSLHLPTSENFPMTNMMSHGFKLAPHNYFDENPAMDLPHFLRMHPTEAEGDTRKEDLPVVPECSPVKYDTTTHTFAGV